MVTGHNFLQRQKVLVEYGEDIEIENECTYCPEGVPETSLHILAECDAFGLLRYDIWGQDKLDLPFSKLKNKDVIEFMRRSKKMWDYIRCLQNLIFPNSLQITAPNA